MWKTKQKQQDPIWINQNNISGKKRSTQWGKGLSNFFESLVAVKLKFQILPATNIWWQLVSVSMVILHFILDT